MEVPNVSNRKGDRLDTLTIEVIKSSTNNHCFHAPAEDGGTVCGLSGAARIRVENAPASATPCGYCFSPEVVEKFEPRDADIHAAVRDTSEREQ